MPAQSVIHDDAMLRTVMSPEPLWAVLQRRLPCPDTQGRPGVNFEKDVRALTWERRKLSTFGRNLQLTDISSSGSSVSEMPSLGRGDGRPT